MGLGAWRQWEKFSSAAVGRQLNGISLLAKNKVQLRLDSKTFFMKSVCSFTFFGPTGLGSSE